MASYNASGFYRRRPVLTSNCTFAIVILYQNTRINCQKVVLELPDSELQVPTQNNYSKKRLNQE